MDALQPNVVIVSYLRGVMAFDQRDWDAAADHLPAGARRAAGHAELQLLMGIVSYARNCSLQLAEEQPVEQRWRDARQLEAAKVLAATRLKLREPEGALVEVLEPIAGSR